jgi:hypothetical protein
VLPRASPSPAALQRGPLRLNRLLLGEYSRAQANDKCGRCESISCGALATTGRDFGTLLLLG